MLDLRNLYEHVKKHSVTKNCSDLSLYKLFFIDLKNFANSRISTSSFKSFSQSLGQFFLTIGQNNFGNKILFPYFCLINLISKKSLKVHYFISVLEFDMIPLFSFYFQLFISKIYQANKLI